MLFVVDAHAQPDGPVVVAPESSLLVMDAMFLATYHHLSSAHHDPREPKKGKVVVKGHKKCNILWILTF